MKGLVSGSAFASIFWVFLFVFHSEGKSWPFAIFLSFSAMAAGLMIAAAILLAVAKKKG